MIDWRSVSKSLSKGDQKNFSLAMDRLDRALIVVLMGRHLADMKPDKWEEPSDFMGRVRRELKQRGLWPEDPILAIDRDVVIIFGKQFQWYSPGYHDAQFGVLMRLAGQAAEQGFIPAEEAERIALLVGPCCGKGHRRKTRSDKGKPRKKGRTLDAR